MVVDLLQQVGLNKYEAEAYAALLQHGPLTGYELGKRSGVPLSRSYEILERLTVKGLALVQPGEPPRYAAESAEQFLARTRSATTATLDALSSALAELGPSALAEGFWVVRGQESIIAQVNSSIGQAQRTVAIHVAPAYSSSFAEALAAARGRGCRVIQPRIEALVSEPAPVLLVIDEREALVGTLTPADRAQAVVGANRGFVAVLNHSFGPDRALTTPPQAESSRTVRETPPLDWLDWEQRKQRRLLDIHGSTGSCKN